MTTTTQTNAYHYVHQIGFNEANQILSSVGFEVSVIEFNGQHYPLEEVKLAAADFELLANSYWAGIPDHISKSYPQMMTDDYKATLKRVEIGLGIDQGGLD